jgi:hypothetical protein
MQSDVLHYVGLDLGQAQDPTALAVLQRPHVHPQAPPRQRRPAYTLPYLRRFPPGTSYTEVFRQLVALLQRPPLPGSFLMVDGTGVGRPVLDMLTEALRNRVTCSYVAVVITTGHEAAWGEGGLHLPRKELVGVLQVLLQTRRLHIPRTLPEASLLVRELENFKAKVTLAGVDPVESWREGEHDDLVLAVALAAWAGEKALPPMDEPPEEPEFTRLVLA